MPEPHQTVAVIGAHSDPNRYSYKAFKMLQAHGHTPLLVGVRDKEIDGVAVVDSLEKLSQTPDTITLYVAPQHSNKMIPALITSGAKRIIMNPGTENDDLRAAAEAAGIAVLEKCTLVLLTTGQF